MIWRWCKGRGLDFELRAWSKGGRRGHRPDEKKSAGLCFRILGDPMRWNIGRLASSRGRAWWLFERVECIRESVGCAEFFTVLTEEILLSSSTRKNARRLVSMPPVKPPSCTNLSSGKSWRRFRRSVRFLRVASKHPPHPVVVVVVVGMRDFLRVFLTRVHSFREEQRGDTFVFLPTDVLLKAFFVPKQKRRRRRSTWIFFIEQQQNSLLLLLCWKHRDLSFSLSLSISQVSTSKRSNIRTFRSRCGMSGDKTRFVRCGDTTSKTRKAWSSSSIVTIATASPRREMNFTACSTKTNSATRFCWSLRTSKICRTRWLRLKLRTNLDYTRWDKDTGSFNLRARLRAKACTKAWIGFLRTLQTTNRRWENEKEREIGGWRTRERVRESRRDWEREKKFVVENFEEKEKL